MNSSTTSTNTGHSIPILSKSEMNYISLRETISVLAHKNNIASFRDNYIKCIDSKFKPKIVNDQENKNYSRSPSKNKKKFQKIKSIRIHRKISRIPYSLKDEEIPKLIFINRIIRNKKFPKYNSQPIDKTYNKNNLSDNYNNIDLSPKKQTKKINHFLESEKNKFIQKFYFKRDEERTTFNLYFDTDIIEKSSELDDQLIENSFDMDQETDDEGLKISENICKTDIIKGCELMAEDPYKISYIRHNQVNFKK